MTAATQRSADVQSNVLSKIWWAVLLRAIAFIAFAFLAYFRMGHALPSMLLLFLVCALMDGVGSSLGAILGGGSPRA
jgi:hypothetical protein